MKTKLVHKNIESLEIKSLENGMARGKEIRITIGNEIFYNESDDKVIKFRYPVNLDIKNYLSVSLVYDFTFKSNNKITDDFIESEEAKKIIPNIAYPYIKSYLETVVTLSGYKNINLPYFDFLSDPFEISFK